MDINTIDDLLKYLSEYTQIIIGHYTKETERNIVLEAEQLKLVYKNRENTFHLDRLGKQVVDTRLTWAAFQAEKEEEKYSFDKAVEFHVKQQIDKETFRKTGGSYYSQSVSIEHQQERAAGEPNVLPLSSVEQLSWWQKFKNLQDSPVAGQRVQFWAGISTLIVVIFPILAWSFLFLLKLIS